MLRITQIEERLAAIKIELAGELTEDQITALESEVESLSEERKALLNVEERRNKLRSSIAEGSVEARRIATPAANEVNEDPVVQALSSPEYRSGYLRSLQGVPDDALSTAERRALKTVIEHRSLTVSDDSAGAVVPEHTANMIVETIGKLAPLINEIELLRVKGTVKIAVESVVNDAALHKELAEATDAEDKLVYITLGGYEIMKFISISASVRTMSIDAFETWLVNQIARKCAKLIEHYIINGTGNEEPKGIEAARTWEDGTSAVVYTGTVPTYANICSLIALLPSEFDANAKFLMNKKCFWGRIQAIRDDGKAPIVHKNADNTYNIMGYPVLISDEVADDAIYLGDFKQMYGNLPQDITIEDNAASGFRRNAVDYRGVALFDCKPANPAAFVKMSKSA